MNRFFLVLSLLLLTGCGRVQVSQDYDTGVRFDGYFTYGWMEQHHSASDDVRETNPLLHKRIHAAISRVMEERGYDHSESPDLRVAYDYSVRSKIESSPFVTSVGFGVGTRYRYGGIGYYGAPYVYQYDVGVLTVDIYDSRSEQLIWRGTGSEMVTTHSSPEASEEMVRRVVRSILAQFPPGR